MFKIISGTIFFFVLIHTNIFSQTLLDDRIRNYIITYGKGYVQPLIDAMGENLTSGWSSYESLDDNKISFDAGFQSVIMFVSDEQKSFRIASPYDNIEQEVPTIMGSEESVKISRTNIPSEIEIFPESYAPGYNYNAIPLFIPQVSIGNIAGTRLTLRFLPKIHIYEYTFLQAFGLGIQHGISRYFKKLPLNFSVAGAFQYVTLGDIASISAYTFGVQLYKNISVLSLFTDIGYKFSNVKFDYTATFSDPAQPDRIKSERIQFDANGKNGVKAAAGIALNFFLLKLNLGYTITSPQTLNIGIGFGL